MRKAPIKRIQRKQSASAPNPIKMHHNPVIDVGPINNPRSNNQLPQDRNILKQVIGSAIVLVALMLIFTVGYTLFQIRPRLLQPAVQEVAALPTAATGAVLSQLQPLATATLQSAELVEPIPADEPLESPREEEGAEAEALQSSLIVPQLSKPAPLDSTPGRLIVPGLGIEEDVLELDLINNAWDIQSLGLGVGLLESTGRFPGDDFSMVFAGHVRTRWSLWGPFSQLSTLENGSQVIYQWDGHNFVYEITGRRRMEPAEGELLFRHEEGTILLLTCIGYDPTTGDYAERLLVEAKLVQEPFPISE